MGLLQLAALASIASAAAGAFDRGHSSHFVLSQDADTAHRIGQYGSKNFDRKVLQSLESAHALLANLLDLLPRRSTTVVIYDPQVFAANFGAALPLPVAGFYQG